MALYRPSICGRQDPWFSWILLIFSLFASRYLIWALEPVVQDEHHACALWQDSRHSLVFIAASSGAHDTPHLQTWQSTNLRQQSSVSSVYCCLRGHNTHCFEYVLCRYIHVLQYSLNKVGKQNHSTEYRYSRDDALQIIGTILPVLPALWIYGIGLQEIQNRVFSTITWCVYFAYQTRVYIISMLPLSKVEIVGILLHASTLHTRYLQHDRTPAQYQVRRREKHKFLFLWFFRFFLLIFLVYVPTICSIHTYLLVCVESNAKSLQFHLFSHVGNSQLHGGREVLALFIPPI